MSIRTTVIAITLGSCFVMGCEKTSSTPVADAAKTAPKPKPKPPVSMPGLATVGEAVEMAPGVWVWDLQMGDGASVGSDARTVSVSISGWAQDGTQYFGSSAGADELVLPAGNAAAFPGWAEAIDGLRVGGTRKVWAVATQGADNWPVANDSPVVLDIVLNDINANATMNNPLPGAPLAGAAPQGGAEGLRFYDLSNGSGIAAENGDRVSIRYQAWLADGTPMGSAMSDPVMLVLDESIAPGIRAGLQGVKAGAQRKLIVPASVGIGFDPLGTLPAGSTVVMDIDVLDVQTSRPKPSQATAEAN